MTCAGPGQRARILHREQTVRRGSCESWQKLSWSCTKAKHVPYLGFVTTLTEVPGVDQSRLLAAPAKGTCWAGRVYRHGVFHSQSWAHAAITLVTRWQPLGQRWTQPLLPAEPFLHRAVLGSQAGAMAAPWKEERETREGRSVDWEKGAG